MRLARIFRMRLRSLFSRGKVEQELDEEMTYHLERQVEENIAAGLDPQAARLDALRSVKGLEQRKEECRDVRGLNLLDNLVRDFRFAMRQLRRCPAFAATVVVILALGMCANVAIFAFVDAALIKPLPYRDSARLVSVYETAQACPQCPLSYIDYLDWKKLNTAFQSMDAYVFTNVTLRVTDGAQSVDSFRVSPGFFRTLGITPIMGRDFQAGEDSPATPHTVMLSYSAWRRRFAGDRDVLGKTVTLNDDPRTIIGVLPPEFYFASSVAEFWTPLYPGGGCNSRRNCHVTHVIARLKDSASLQTALANVKWIAEQLERQYPDSNRGYGAKLTTLAETLVGDIRPILLVLLSGAGLLLLIASMNVASLLLVRSESRKREMAVRTALGASRARIIGQFAAEGLVLTAAGTVLGLAMASWAMHLLASLIPENQMIWLPFLRGLGLNSRICAFSGLIALLASALFSFMPVVHLALSDKKEGMAEGARGSSARAWRRLGSKLVVVELATAVVLLVGAGLLGKSLYYLLQVNLGLQPEHVVTIQVSAPRSYAASNEKAIALERQIVNQIETLPDVKSVAISDNLPVIGGGDVWLVVAGRPVPPEHNSVAERTVSSAYFATLGAKLVRGRYFSEAEDQSKPHLGIINQTFANRYFHGENPIGKQLAYESKGPQVPMEIVGVVEDLRERQLDSASYPVLYVPFVHYVGTYFNVLVRSSAQETPLLAALSKTIHQIDPNIATKDATRLIDVIHDSQSAYLHRTSAWLVGGFAVLALLLGVVGLYGVVAYSVGQRTREIGIRMALGASRRSVYRLVLKEAMWLTSSGIVIGLACSVAASSLIRGLLFGVQSWDVPTWIVVSAVLSVSAILASYFPARCAATVNPVEALRAE